MRAALDDQHAAPGLGQPVGDDRAAGARADHDRVVAVLRRRLERAQRRARAVLGAGEPAAGALGVRLEADPVPRALVAVVAEVGHLRRDADHPLHRRPQRGEHAAARDVGDEALLEVALARLGGHRGERHPQREQREDREHREREPHAPLAGGLQRGEVAVHVAGDVLGRDVLHRPLDHDLRQRDQRAERERVQVAEAVALLHGQPPAGDERRREHDVDRHPADEVGDRVDRRAERRHGVLAADRQHHDLREDQADVAERDEQRHPPVAADVRGAEQADRREQPVLGDRVHDEAELLAVPDRAGEVDRDEREGDHRVDEQQRPQPLLGARERCVRCSRHAW